MDTQKINFRQSRNFSETFNISVQFLRQNFKTLFQSLIFIGGPFVLAAAITTALSVSSALTRQATVGGNQLNRILGQMSVLSFTNLLFTLVANAALAGVVFSFIINYIEKDPGTITVNDVRKTFFRNFGKIMAVLFSFTGVTLGFIIFIGVIFFGMFSASVSLGVVFTFGAIIIGLILFPPLVWRISSTYLVKMQEKKGVFESFGRTGQVMSGNFWVTWLIIFCSYLAAYLVAFVMSLPQIVYRIIFVFSHYKGEQGELSTAFFVIAFVCTFFSTMVYSLVHIVNGFHYYSLEERKDGLGLIERIDEIGKTPANEIDQHY